MRLGITGQLILTPSSFEVLYRVKHKDEAAQMIHYLNGGDAIRNRQPPVTEGEDEVDHWGIDES